MTRNEMIDMAVRTACPPETHYRDHLVAAVNCEDRTGSARTADCLECAEARFAVRIEFRRIWMMNLAVGIAMSRF